MRISLPVMSARTGADRNEVQRLVNCHIEQASPRSEESFSVIGTPGNYGIWDTGQASVRAMRYWGDDLYAVSGGGLYRLNPDSSSTLLGPVPATGRVMMAEVPNYLIVLAGDEVVMWDKSNFSSVVIPSFGGVPSILPQAIAVVNLTLVITLQGGDFYCWSAPNDPGNITGTDIARAERNGDITLTIAEDHNELLLIGRKSMEVLYDTGVADGRFQSVGSGVIERGCSAPDSIAKNDNTLFWLGDDRIIYRLEGRTPVRVSTHGCESDIQKFSRVDDAYGLTYTFRGHKFYAITFPSAGRTWEINLNTGSAHERRTSGQSHWLACCAETGYGNEPLIGDAFSGSVMALSDSYTTENGAYIERVVRTPFQQFDRARFVTSRLEIDLDTGLAPARGMFSDPALLLRHSENGKQWSQERRRVIGRAGEYDQRVTFHRLGQARRRSYEIRTTDPIPWRITAIHAHVELGEL